MRLPMTTAPVEGLGVGVGLAIEHPIMQLLPAVSHRILNTDLGPVLKPPSVMAHSCRRFAADAEADLQRLVGPGREPIGDMDV